MSNTDLPGSFSTLSLDPATAAQTPRIAIESVTPAVDNGQFAAKGIAGRVVEVTAKIFADGHDKLAASVLWRQEGEENWQQAPLTLETNDLWRGRFTPPVVGRYEYVVQAWWDVWGTYRYEIEKKYAAGVGLNLELQEGRIHVEQALSRAEGEQRGPLEALLQRLDQAGSEGDKVAVLLAGEASQAMAPVDAYVHLTHSIEYPLDIERLRAEFASWYELFPRSITDDPQRHGTFRNVIGELPRVRDMGFDVLYFPPIHPIGLAHRKGKNNTLGAGADQPGSPYAIGSPDGGHDAVHPELGTLDDFRALVAAAADHGLEIALDFAIQCSPDHPWLKEHPGWFSWRPDGSMRYAENPPKKYQDIVNVDFYAKDAAMMARLGKVGYSQSYTYFTWRNTKAELTEYFTQLNEAPLRDCYRPNFFVNTPDINPAFLQTSGRPGFLIRAALATMGSGLWGMYAGFELCEGAPLTPGKEEYLDSEKYELRPRDFYAPGNIMGEIAQLNRIRRQNPALQTHLGLKVYTCWNDQILYFGKRTDDLGNFILVAINLDPFNAQEGHFELPLWELGLDDHATTYGEDLMTGHRWAWHGKTQWTRLEPSMPFGIWRIQAGH